MTKQATGLFLLAVLTAAGGCNVCRAIVYDPFGANTLCDSRRCTLQRGCGTCGPACDAPCGPACGPAIAACGDGCCPDCGAVGCGGRCRRIIRGPFTVLAGLLGFGSYQGCDGCGERYWGDWYGDPPECCDPCDQFGNFSGGGCSRCGGGGAPAMSGPVYEGAPMPPQSGGCRHCGQGANVMPSSGPANYPAQYASTPRMQGYSQAASGPVQRRPSQYAGGSRPQWGPAQVASTPANTQGAPGAQGAGQYAPRLISTTDRVLKPATPDQSPRLAQPQRADIWQE